MVLLFGLNDTIQKNALITPWSIIHFLGGYMFSVYGIHVFKISIMKSFWIGFILHTIYEIKDLSCYFLNCHDKSLWNNNSWINSIMDTIFFIVGFFLILIIDANNFNYIIIFTLIYLAIIILFIFHTLEI
jgi:hypothetical protein